MQSNSVTRPLAKEKKKKKGEKVALYCTCLSELEVQNCKSTLQSALVFFFLSIYVHQKKSIQSFLQTRTHTRKKKITTVLRQYQFHLLFEQELKKSNRDLGSDWHTGCYNQPTLSVTDGK